MIVGEPNEALGALIIEANGRTRCSWAGIARRINDLGADLGLALRYDYTAVHRWVRRGEKPRPPVPELLAQALSEKLGRPVRPGEFGMSDEHSLAARSLAYQSSPAGTVETIAELGQADVGRRSVVRAPFVLAALAAPSRNWLISTLEETADERGPRAVGMRQVAGIREMFALFQEMDVMRGGGHARTALIEYMNSYVMPLTRKQHPEPVQRAIHESAAEQAYLVGWMAYDDGQHGLAQRYLIQALRLAEASGNSVLGAHVLAGMSDQANLLGHHDEALNLARAGRSGITIADSPACFADLCVLESRAHASLGDSRAALSSAVKAEEVFGQVESDNEPEWARFIDLPYVFGELAHTFRDLRMPAESERFAAESASAADSQGRARRGALSHAALAVGALERNDVETAAARALTVVDLAGSVNSWRAIETVRDLQHRLAPFATTPEVATFNDRARQVLGLAA
ncbi:hypothetical protein [Actinokineospora enzanensis]|uniref:hypothetical protein n=1 Tax=Actinokineospora enzanensis TaxID=155975 RepID=UPI0003A836DE|nr:hypothetical protein [Actinokineospora enzanensis]